MNDLDFKLDHYSRDPLHLQIAKQVKQFIATKKLRSGDHLPPVRRLADSLNINQNTILKAYTLLKQDKVVVARKRGGTVVTANTDDPYLFSERQKRLLDMVNNDILNILGLGYSPENLEAAFNMILARWRKERKTLTVVPREVVNKAGGYGTSQIGMVNYI
jgi:GntR family transcriptional regulator